MKNVIYHLYGTQGCHLCDLAQALCEQVITPVQIELVDIIDDQHLVELYSTTIPVLAHLSSNTALYWPFDLQQLKEFIRGTN